MAKQHPTEEKPVSQGTDDQTQQAFDQQAPAPSTAPKFTRKRRITLDVTNLQKLGAVVACMQSELYEKELPSKFHPSGKAISTCVDIVNVHTGEEYMLACNTVLASALRRACMGGIPQNGGSPDAAFEPGVVRMIPLTGRYFAMRCGEVEAGKRYRRVDVVELERAE